MDAAITQGMAQKDVRDVRETSKGEKSSLNVNKVISMTTGHHTVACQADTWQ